MQIDKIQAIFRLNIVKTFNINVFNIVGSNGCLLLLMNRKTQGLKVKVFALPSLSPNCRLD